MVDYPRGCCGNTTEMLGAYLTENGISGFEYISGSKSDSSHAWLEKDGIIIDITRGQFGNKGCGIIKASEDRWYDEWERESCGDATAKTMNTILRCAYADICQVIEKTQ